MKKLIAAMLILGMLLTMGGTWAEETDAIRFETWGEALQEAGEEPFTGGDENVIALILERDGRFFRVVAYMDDTARELMEAMNFENDEEKYLALEEQYAGHVSSLPVAYTEELTAVPLDQEILDGYAGTTLENLGQDGFSLTGAYICVEDPEAADGDPAVVAIENGIFSYHVTLDLTRGEFEDLISRDEPVEDMPVRSAACAGLSWNALNPDFLADGTMKEDEGEAIALFEDPENMDFGEATEFMNILMDAINGKDIADVDTEALFESLIRLMPGKEEEIREMIPELLSFISQQREEMDAE